MCSECYAQNPLEQIDSISEVSSSSLGKVNENIKLLSEYL